MLESEAKTKLCPFTLGIHSIASKCIGSACMGWAEHTKYILGTSDEPGHEARLDSPQGDCGMKS